MKKTIAASMACLVLSIILMCLPYGVAMPFSDGPANIVVSYYAYFSGMPLGYGNVCPLLTAAFSVAMVALLAVAYKGRLRLVRRICAGILPMFSLFSWLLFNTYTPLALIIFLLHLTVCVLQFWRTEAPTAN